MNLTIVREIDDGKCCVGSIDIFGSALQTLERPWVGGPKGGTKGFSCIPAGKYQLVKHDTEAYPRSFALVNEALGVYHLTVPSGEQGRTACLIHAANYVQELRGCIALGMSREPYMGSYCVRQSRAAINNFYNRVPWIDGHTLEIVGP